MILPLRWASPVVDNPLFIARHNAIKKLIFSIAQKKWRRYFKTAISLIFVQYVRYPLMEFFYFPSSFRWSKIVARLTFKSSVNSRAVVSGFVWINLLNGQRMTTIFFTSNSFISLCGHFNVSLMMSLPKIWFILRVASDALWSVWTHTKILLPSAFCQLLKQQLSQNEY